MGVFDTDLLTLYFGVVKGVGSSEGRITVDVWGAECGAKQLFAGR